MDEKTARDMDRLLAGGRLSGPEADAILERVLDSVAREERRPVRRIGYWASGALAAAAAVLLMVYLPRPPGPGPEPFEMGDLPGLDVTCAAGSLSACPKSSSLIFEVSDDNVSGYLSAYAEPIGHDGERVWYLSKEDGSAELAKPAQGARPSKRAVRFPESQKPGRYRVQAVLAERPLGRAEVLKAVSGPKPGAAVRAKVHVDVVVTQ